jgi:ribosomal protein S21|tara:strand:+ start:7595 stop:7909 length:315 start_codon:yes stop_codon:yes gene_type:complete
MQYQKNKTNFNSNKPRFVKKESTRPLGFHGYYVEVRDGEDPLRAYRKMKKWIKEDKFVETVKAKSVFMKPSEKKREKAKEKKLVLRKLRRERDENVFMGRIKRK